MYITEAAMQVSRWGNSLAIRLPRAVVEARDLKEGDDIEIVVAGTRSFEVRHNTERARALARPRSLRLRCGATGRRSPRPPAVCLRVLLSEPLPLTLETHDAALRLAREKGLAFPDSLIVAAALQAKCPVLYSEDLQDGLTVEGLIVRNPFAARPGAS